MGTRSEDVGIEEWTPAEAAKHLADRERVLVLFHTGGPSSRRLLREFHAAEPEASVPFAKVRLARADPARRAHGIEHVPTLIYFEHGEELERLDGLRGQGISRKDFEELLAEIEAIQHEPFLPKRMHGARRG